MFDFSKFNEIGKDIYVYKNFIPKDVCDYYFKIVTDIKEEDWQSVSDAGRYFSKQNSVDFRILNDKILNEIGLNKDYYVNEVTRALRIVKGGYMGPHADNVEYDNLVKESGLYKEGSPYDLRENSHYGIVFYFNEFIGGEIEYPKQNVVYKPEVGDLVIHSAKEHCAHAVKKVLSDVRYSYSNNIYSFVKINKGYIPFPGLGKATYVTDEKPFTANRGETWFQPCTGRGYIWLDGYWTNVPR